MTHLDDRNDLPRRLGLFSTITTVIAPIIGTGIYLKASAISQLLPDPTHVVIMWVVAGLLTLCGALVMTELGAMYPHSGGLYLYLTEAFGPFVGFLFGWAMLTILQTGSLAGFAAGIMQAVSNFSQASGGAALTPHQQIAGAMDLILLFTLINCVSVRAGAGIQNFLTVLKATGLVVLVAGVVFLGRASGANWVPGAPNPEHTLLAAFGLAMIKALWVYDGWIDVSYIAGEVENPQKNLPKAMLLGMGFVILIYVSVNASYHLLMPVEAVQASKAAAASAAGVLVGQQGILWMSLIIVLSSTGALNTSLMTGGRVYFAMARERWFFPVVGSIHRRFQTPHVSLILQGIWSCLLLLAWGEFETITDNVTFCYWIFYVLGGIAMIVLRFKQPNAERPYRCPGYPVVPALFILIGSALVINTIASAPDIKTMTQALILLGSGVVTYPFFKHFYNQRPE